MTITEITDHVEQAQAQAVSRWQSKPRMLELIRILNAEVQLFDGVVWDVYSTVLDNAEGEQLEEYGDMFDEPRGGLGDDDYRRTLKVVMGAHQSDASAPQTIYLFAQLVGVAVRYIQQGRACFEISYDTDNPATLSADWRERLQRISEILRPVGVELSVIEGDISGTGNPFQLDTDGQGLDDGELCDRVV